MLASSWRVFSTSGSFPSAWVATSAKRQSLPYTSAVIPAPPSPRQPGHRCDDSRLATARATNPRDLQAGQARASRATVAACLKSSNEYFGVTVGAADARSDSTRNEALTAALATVTPPSSWAAPTEPVRDEVTAPAWLAVASRGPPAADGAAISSREPGCDGGLAEGAAMLDGIAAPDRAAVPWGGLAGSSRYGWAAIGSQGSGSSRTLK